MSYLTKNNFEYVSSRLTNNGRKSISKGEFNITYFSIGDSEYNYTFSGITGDIITQDTHQKVIYPKDMDNNIKYPIKYDNDIVYGLPILNNETIEIRNVMGNAGFVDNYKNNPKIYSLISKIPYSSITNTNEIVLTKSTGTTFNNSEYLTLIFSTLSTQNEITGNTNSLVYKIISVSGLTTTTEKIVLDRKLPTLTGLTGYATFISNNCDNEFGGITQIDNYLPLITTTQQLNPWKLNIVWSKPPIGFQSGYLDISLFNSAGFNSTKEYFGYNSTGQTFINSTGLTINNHTTYPNSFSTNATNNLNTLLPNDQKCIAILHYTEYGDLYTDPDRYFKYDDYISTNNIIEDSLITDDNDYPLTDVDYFEIHIPFIKYHINNYSTKGAIFTMDTTDYYVRSVKNENHKIRFRYLLSESGYKVGKIFVDKQIIIIDDEELVACLDYKSNRRYTLPAPKITHKPINSNSSLLSGVTGTTIWVTYGFSYTGNTSYNSLPCNYFLKLESNTTTSDVSFNFGNSTTYMVSNLSNINNGFVANKFFILVQITNNNEFPLSNNWKSIDYTTEAGGDGTSLLDYNNIYNVTFDITKTKYDSASNFILHNHINDTYTGQTSNFGDEQYFPGSIRLVRSSKIETMNYLLNLPTDKFNISQNPTYNNGDVMITDFALLNNNKETMVIGKTSKPIKRMGNQIISIKLDF